MERIRPCGTCNGMACCPVLYAFAGIGIIGFLLAVWGLIEKDA